MKTWFGISIGKWAHNILQYIRFGCRNCVFLFVARISQLNSILSAFIYVYEINCLLLSLPKLIALLTLGTIATAIATAILKRAIPKLYAAYWILDAFPARIDSYFWHAISQCDFDDELFFYLKYDWVNGWWAAKCQLVYECIDDRDADAYNTNIYIYTINIVQRTYTCMNDGFDKEKNTKHEKQQNQWEWMAQKQEDVARGRIRLRNLCEQ